MNRRLLLVFAAALTIGAIAVIGAGSAAAQETGVQPERCAQVCREQAQAELRACLDTGASPERCRQRAQTKLEQCMTRCRRASGVAPVPSAVAPRACHKRCEEVGRSVLQACLVLPIGPSLEQCQRRAAQAVRMCMEKTCPTPQPDPDPANCEEACAKRSREFYQRCTLGSTGSTPPEECGRKAREMYQECLRRCKRASATPEPRPGLEECRQNCRERVAAFKQSCLAQPGAVAERCEQQAARKLEACVASCPQP